MLLPWEDCLKKRSISTCKPALLKPRIVMTRSLNENFRLRVKSEEASLASKLKSSLVMTLSKLLKSPEIKEVCFLRAQNKDNTNGSLLIH